MLPELSVPRAWLRPLAERLTQEGISLVAGLEYRNTKAGVVNEAVGVFASAFHLATVARWPKSRPARGEEHLLRQHGLSFSRGQDSPVLVVRTNFGDIATLICSEILDVRRRATLRGRADIVVVPAWNQDTATFDHVLQTAANDLHCYFAVANVAAYSDCRVQVPRKQAWQREVCRLISRGEDDVIACVIDVRELREFQRRSVADPSEAEADGKSAAEPPFKPIPPGFEYQR